MVTLFTSGTAMLLLRRLSPLLEGAASYQRPARAWYEDITVMDIAILKKVGLFQGLSQGQLQKIAGITVERAYEGSATVFEEGDPGLAMYIILEGKVRISKRVPGVGEEALAILEPGQYFGEMALIEEGPRSADAIAHIPCRVCSISREKLEQLMFTDKELAYVLLWTFVRTLSERLRETNDKIRGFFALSSFGPK
jgi:CRP/FNR family transcriptional regulator, cyclic AMP receptor protein